MICICIHVGVCIRGDYKLMSFSMFLHFTFGALSERRTSPAKLDGRKSSSHLPTPTLGEPDLQMSPCPALRWVRGSLNLGSQNCLSGRHFTNRAPYFLLFETRYYSVAYVGLEFTRKPRLTQRLQQSSCLC